MQARCGLVLAIGLVSVSACAPNADFGTSPTYNAIVYACHEAYGYGSSEYQTCMANQLALYQQTQAIEDAAAAQERAANLNLMATGLSMMQPQRPTIINCQPFGIGMTCIQPY
jgi:hypothetical protein